ncbi:hypothetical protein [Candidatus Hamiltonella defensa]|uniref:hypothetical protein n=1 Tax=Candidatus Williamhamiltonella defendens TaxID=138072 RepID=UPI001313E59B|nr:hypothetical protein [Candidatus Hamiltonella defensa]
MAPSSLSTQRGRLKNHGEVNWHKTRFFVLDNTKGSIAKTHLYDRFFHTTPPNLRRRLR